MWSYQEPIILQCAARTATYLEYPEVQDAQRHGHGKEGWNQTITEQDTSWTVNLQWRKTEHLSEQYLEAVVAAGKKVDHQQIKKSERLHEWKAYGSSWKPGWLYWPLIYFLKYSGLRFIHILDWPRAL